MMTTFIGRYATGVIVGRYRAGGLLDVSVEVTANHGGQRNQKGLTKIEKFITSLLLQAISPSDCVQSRLRLRQPSSAWTTMSSASHFP